MPDGGYTRSVASPPELKWRSDESAAACGVAAALPAAALGPIAGACLVDVYMRRVLGALFGGAASKGTVSRTGHKVQMDFAARNQRHLSGELIVRLLLSGTAVKVRSDRRATSLPVLVALGVRAVGRRVVLAMRVLGGASEAAWQALLDDLVTRPSKFPGRRTPVL